MASTMTAGTSAARTARAGAMARACIVVAATALVVLATCQVALADEATHDIEWPTVQDMFSMGLGNYIACCITCVLFNLIRNCLAPCCEVLFSWSTDFMTIPVVNKVILYTQGIAASLVIAIRIAYGIKEGIFLNGGSRETSVGEYVFKSIVSVAVVALMPMICRTVVSFGNALYLQVVGTAGSMSDVLGWFDIGNVDWSWLDGSTFNEWNALLWTFVGLFAIMILTFACGYQFIRRQVEMVTISIIGPIVSVYSASDDTSQLWDLLKNLFGLTCVQWIQYLLVLVALGFGQSWLTGMQAKLTNPFIADAQMFMATIAFFAAALTVPAIVDRYTYGGQGSQTGSRVVGAAVGFAANNAVRAPFAAAGRIGKSVAGFGKGVYRGYRG